jgi:hypothetical protein
MSSIRDILSSVSQIRTLYTELPPTIPQGSSRCKITQVLDGPEYESPWQTFNKRFDALFAEDCRDEAGRLHHIRRGEHGMDKVNNYLASIDFTVLPLDLVAIKLDRLKVELEDLL